MEDISDADYAHARKILLADAFENFRNKYLEIYELDPANLFQLLV